MKIEIQTRVISPVEKVWELYTSPEHIINWNFASEDWRCPKALNDLRKGGSFNFRIEAKDGSGGFNLRGTYEEVITHEIISYTLEDNRTVTTTFQENKGITKIITVFEAEETNPKEMQKKGWQAILDHFKTYVENK